MMHVYTGLLNKLKLSVDNTLLHCREPNCLRIRDLSLSFIILYSLYSFYIPQPFLICFHTLTAAGDSVKIGHVQQESPLASLLPFFR